jgi:hypothetical protein
VRNILVAVTLGICVGSAFAQSTQQGVPGQQLSNQNVLQQFADRQGLTPKVAPTGPPDEPVVTLDGLCVAAHGSAKKPVPCKTVLTRAQMDALMNALAPGNADARSQFTVSYARLLAASASAEKQHLDKDPAVAKELEAKLKFVRMQVLTEALYRKIELEADKVDLAQAQKYYADHLSTFDEGELQRISFPQSARTTSGTPLDLNVVKAKAEEIRLRAVSGEDFDLLQRIAYTDLGINSPVLPITRLDKARRANMAFNQGKVFDLEPGGVTDVMNSVEGLVILKLVSKHPASFDSVEQEIHATLREARVKEQLETAAGKMKADFNLAYLGTTTEPILFPPPAVVRLSPSAVKAASDARARTVARRRKIQALPTLPPAASPATPPSR